MNREKPRPFMQQEIVNAASGELSSARFLAALAAGQPIRLDGMELRLQGDWTPAAMSHAVADVDISCIDCNSPDEKITTMPASTFFALLENTEHDVTERVYKVKVRENIRGVFLRPSLPTLLSSSGLAPG